MITFKRVKESITESDLVEFESMIGLTLPEDYKKHMLKYNGGKPTPSLGVYFGTPNNSIELSRFHSIKYGSSTIKSRYEDSKRYLPGNHITIGYTITGNLCMSLDEKSYGHIYVYYSDVELEFLASSFTEFINGLNVYESEDEY